MSQQAFQKTLAAPTIFAGVGVHTGEHVRVSLRPAAANAGIVFVRTDLSGDNRLPARGDLVVQTRLGTVLGNAAGATVSTVEHLMAAFAALGVDNAVVELDGPEMPIMDGSAQPFIELIDRVGLRDQDAPRRYIEILEPIAVIEDDKAAMLLPAAGGGFELSFEIEFDSQAIGRQKVDLAITEQSFRDELADCRTFGFAHEVEALRAAGLARGGSMDNCIVIEGERVLNPEGLRRPDEFVRHKALDAVGDLYLLGAPLIGRFEGVKAGHGLNNAVVRALMARPSAWRWHPPAADLAEAV
ncbi:MAG TPA: UDP-3-O-acyl-N-acetylglucosamine deacetylase [Phenylobacterium sp.]|nr:UDP-3-O-acyl-N-acetylglucosamine deacetylase [Phenylobacterium sp.]